MEPSGEGLSLHGRKLIDAVMSENIDSVAQVMRECFGKLSVGELSKFTGPHGRDAFFLACETGNIRIVQYLRECGFTSRADADGATPFSICFTSGRASSPKHRQVARFLAAHGDAALQAKGWSPLLHACASNDLAVLRREI